MKKLILLLFIPFIFSCSDDSDSKTELFELMQGSFDSKKQSFDDSNYFDITLHMYPIWDNRGNFLYVEQSVSSMQETPYRQRIYEITNFDKP